MPRKLRIQYPGAMQHVMSPGDQREAIFKDDEDRQKFLTTLSGVGTKVLHNLPQQMDEQSVRLAASHLRTTEYALARKNANLSVTENSPP